jgi:flagellin-specific chaperone FliS
MLNELSFEALEEAYYLMEMKMFEKHKTIEDIFNILGTLPSTLDIVSV